MYGECENFAVLKGHAGAVMELQFSADGRYSVMLLSLLSGFTAQSTLCVLGMLIYPLAK